MNMSPKINSYLLRAYDLIGIVRKTIKTSFLSTNHIGCDSTPGVMLINAFRWQGSCPGQQYATKISTALLI